MRLETLIEPFDANRVDCASYRLSIGNEVYVSPSDKAVDPNCTTVRTLEEGEAFTIPPGQFAFLITEEIVTVPADALAFISIRAKTKFRGLINVSGFHVDPGFRGQLTFSVFNAGPVPVHLQRGKEIFLIWYASLDCETEKKKNYDEIQRGLDTDLVTSISGELHSFASLLSRIQDVDKTLKKRIVALENEQFRCRVIGAILLAIVVGLFVNWFMDNISQSSAEPLQSISETKITTS